MSIRHSVNDEYKLFRQNRRCEANASRIFPNILTAALQMQPPFMQQNRVKITEQISAPVEIVFDRLADHNRMSEWLDADIKRTRDSTVTTEGPNGTGSVRTLRMFGLLEFDETVVRCKRPSAIEYEITRGSPLRDHHGAITLTPDGNTTAIEWNIVFNMAIPFTGFLTGFLLKAAIGRGLAKLKNQIEGNK
jgi:uncharacterized protein YndB with AHSA1/START domain